MCFERGGEGGFLVDRGSSINGLSGRVLFYRLGRGDASMITINLRGVNFTRLKKCEGADLRMFSQFLS